MLKLLRPDIYTTRVDSRSLQKNTVQVWTKIEQSVGKLENEDLATFLRIGIYFCPQDKIYYLNPAIDPRLKALVSPITHRTGVIEFRTITALQVLYQEGLVITSQVSPRRIIRRGK